MTDYIVNEKGEEVISARHRSDYKPEEENASVEAIQANGHTDPSNFTDIEFDDI